MNIRRLDKGDAERWDAFVDSCPEATFFHRAGWKEVIERAFGHPTHYLYAEAEGAIHGVLPLGHVRSRLFGNALISVPFCVYGGIAADCPAARDSLERAACNLAEQLGAEYLEMRNLVPRNPNWPSKDLYVTFKKEIDPDPERNLLAVPRKQRAMIRKGISAGLVSKIGNDVDRFYAVYSESLRNLGTPVLSVSYFRLLKEVFGGSCEVLTVSSNDRVISGVMSFYFRDEVLPYYGGGTQEARALKANDFMYWELMRRAGERGVHSFDYGRSKQGTGSYDFKKNWGFSPRPLRYEYYLIKCRDVPNVNPLNPRYRLFVNLWRHIPVSVTRSIGPMIARNLA